MNLLPNSSNSKFINIDKNTAEEYKKYITPSDIIEYNYCKRFIYYMVILGISQHEEKRYKVLKGRELHNKKETTNKLYLRKKLNVIDKKINVYLKSEKYGIKGIVDEVLTLSDGTMAPLDYKFAEYKGKIYDTYKTQIIMYSMMISEIFDVDVKKGYIVYERGAPRHIEEIKINNKNISKVINNINEFNDILEGYFPGGTKYKKRCMDCCYKNLCPK
jgi:CRISPR-associated exonuclease Cas4